MTTNAGETIFEPSWAARIPNVLRWADPFVHQLARAADDDRLFVSIRSQLEQCWAEIPQDRRPAVLLGLLRSKQDLQHYRARDVLFTGTALARLGWDVHWEPADSDGRTPDFRLLKNNVEVLAEAVTPEVESPLPATKDTLRFRDSIDTLESEYGIWVDELVFDAKADAAAVRAHFKTAIDAARAANAPGAKGECTAPGVSIRYRLERRTRTMRCPYFGTEMVMFWGPTGCEELRGAIIRKIRKYQRPMVVITGVATGGSPEFDALDEAMYGGWSVQFSRTSSASREVRGGGLMIEPGEDGDLLRKYLLGVLGVRVEMPMGAVRHQLRLRLFHAQGDRDDLRQLFAPLPQHTLQPNGKMMDLKIVGDQEWVMHPGSGLELPTK